MKRKNIEEIIENKRRKYEKLHYKEIALYEPSKSIPIHLTDDFDFIMEIVNINGDGLRHASDRLKDNKDIVFEAVYQNGESIKHASKRLKDDEDIVLLSIKHKHGFVFASQRLRNIRDIVLEAVKLWGDNYRFQYKFRNDFEIALETVKRDGSMLGIMPEEIKNNEIIVFYSLLFDITNYKLMGKKLKRKLQFTKINEIPEYLYSVIQYKTGHKKEFLIFPSDFDIVFNYL
jgi:hypothetical protein